MALKKPEEMNVAEWWNIKKAAAYLGVSVAFLRKGVRLKQVPFVRVGSKILRFRRAELDRWLRHSAGNGAVGSGGRP
jgi:excisionase family DNA binding protein